MRDRRRLCAGLEPLRRLGGTRRSHRPEPSFRRGDRHADDQRIEQQGIGVVSGGSEEGERTVTRRFGGWAALALGAMLTSCERSGTDNQNESRPEGVFSTVRAKPDSPFAITTRSGVSMVSVPTGEFIMGSNKGNADE